PWMWETDTRCNKYFPRKSCCSFIHSAHTLSRPYAQEGTPIHVRLCTNREAAGRHRQGDRRIYPAAQGGGAELLGIVSVSQGEVAFVFGACGAAVLSLLRLRGFGGWVQLCGHVSN